MTAESDTTALVSQSALMTAEPLVTAPRAHEVREPVRSWDGAEPARPVEPSIDDPTAARTYESSPAVTAEPPPAAAPEPVAPPAPEILRAEPQWTPVVPETVQAKRPVEPLYEQPMPAISVKPQTFPLPQDLVQVETAHNAPVQVEQPKAEELPRRPRRPQAQSEAAASDTEPLVQIETRHDSSQSSS